MTGLIMETVVIAFMVGGIFGAIVALHLSSNNRELVKIKNDDNDRNRGQR